MRLPLHPQYTSRYVDLARLLVRYGRSDLVDGVGLDDLGAQALDSEERGSAEQLAADLE